MTERASDGGGKGLERFVSRERLCPEVDVDGGLDADLCGVIARLVAYLEQERSPTELRVLRRRLTSLLRDRDGERAARFLPEASDRARFYLSLHSAASLLRSSRGAVEPERRFFLAQVRRIVEELGRRLAAGGDEAVAEEERRGADDDPAMEEQLHEILSAPPINSPLDDVDHLHDDGDTDWDLELHPDAADELASISQSARRAAADARPKPKPSRPGRRGRSLSFAPEEDRAQDNTK